MDFYPFIRPALMAMDGEDAHKLGLFALKHGLHPKPPQDHFPSLQCDVAGLRFDNPIGLAAGFDKDAEALKGLFDLGFGFVEAGTVTPQPQDGNPRPRVFREPSHGAVINRMGFPGKGMRHFKDNLSLYFDHAPQNKGIVGLNIGMNKTQSDPASDYCVLIKMLAPMADYITINISSPNTPGLRDLQQRGPLLELLSRVMDERAQACPHQAPPIFLKLAPDLNDDQIAELATSVIDAKIDGLILTNTTLERPEFLPSTFREQAGGLSGEPLKNKSTEVIRRFYSLTGGAIPIIGAGGISSGQDALDKIKAGASLVQIYSALAFHGPLLIYYVKRQLAQILKEQGYTSVDQAIGADHRPDQEGLRDHGKEEEKHYKAN